MQYVGTELKKKVLSKIQNKRIELYDQRLGSIIKLFKRLSTNWIV